MELQISRFAKRMEGNLIIRKQAEINYVYKSFGIIKILAFHIKNAKNTS